MVTPQPNSSIRFTKFVLLALASVVWMPQLHSATRTWAGPVDGLWSTGANWSPNGNPDGSDEVVLGSTAEVNFDLGGGGTYIGSLTIDAGGTLTATNGAGALGIANGAVGLSNAGTISLNGSGGTWQINLPATSPMTNSGIIESVGTGSVGSALYLSSLRWDAPSSLDNTGGTIRATDGGSVQFFSTQLGFTVSGGTLATDANSSMIVGMEGIGSGASANITMDNATINNAGEYRVEYTGHEPGSRNTLTNNTAFTNTGVTTVTNTGHPNQWHLDSGPLMTVQGGASFDNQSVLNVVNDSTGSISGPGFVSLATARFQVAADAGTFTNSGTINVTNNANTGFETATFSSAKAITSSGAINVTGNAVNGGARFEVTGGNSFTQTAGSVNLSIGEFSAQTIAINGGSVTGNGTITGNTTFASGTVLAPSNGASVGQLEFVGTLAIAGTYSVEMTGSNVSDFISINGNLDLTGATFSFNSLAGGTLTAGTFAIASYSGTLTGFGAVNIINNTGFGYSLDFGSGSNDQIQVTFTAIPEPSAALLLGVAAVGFWTMRIRRRVN